MTSYQDLVAATSGVTHQWKFEGNGNDSIGSSNFSIATGYTTSSAARHGNGITANGSTKTGSFVTGLATAFNSAYSVEMVFKYTGTTTQELLRINDDVAWEMGTDGKILFYFVGTSQTTASAYNNNAWHHLVVTRDGSRNVLVYIDGTQVLSFQHANSSVSTGNLYVAGSQYTAQACINGQMDEVALYTSVLSSGTVTAHKNAALGNDGGFTATPMAASASFPGGIPVLDRTVSAGVFAASAAMPDAHGYGAKRISISRDAAGNGAAPTATSGNVFNGILYDFELPADFTTTGLKSAVLTCNVSGTGSTLTVKRIEQEWTSGVTYSGAVSSTTVTKTSGYGTVDVTTLLASGPFFGLQLTANNGNLDATLEEGGFTASLLLAYESLVVDVSVNADPMTADAAMPSAFAGIGQTVSADPMTANAALVAPTVQGIRNITVNADPMDAAAVLSTGSVFALPVTVSANTFVASAETVDATVTTTHGVMYFADPMVATASLIRPALVNGVPPDLIEGEDNYFQRVFALAPSVWQRLADTGSTALDRMATYNGTYHFVDVGNFDGPEDRPSVNFSQGSYIEQVEPETSNADEAWIQDHTALQTTLEFSFRTNKANTFLMAGADQSQTSGGVASSHAARELYLTNGHLTFRSRIFAGTPDQIDKEFTGPRNLADGQWHHVVVRSGIQRFDQFATELWIDGKFEIRRFGANGFFGFPDFIGDRPSLIDGSELEQLPTSMMFEGDMAEVVFYNHNHVSDTDIARNYYAFMGWTPVEVAPMTASAEMPTGRGKGNSKKALYLYWSPTDEVFGGLPGKPQQSVEDSVSFDPMEGFVEQAFTSGTQPFTFAVRQGDYFGMKVFGMSVVVSPENTNYRDPLTDDPSLINLETDVDLSDYDVIMFKDWPDEGYELDWYNTIFPGQIERLVNQLRDANDQGIGLYVTNPRLAVDLGIIDRVEYVPSLTEHKFNSSQGAALGLYDYGSALDFPWNIVASDGLTGNVFAAGIGETQNLNTAYLAGKAYYYHDTNSNNRFRVRAVIDGLTDLPGWMVSKSVFHVDLDDFGWQGAAYKYLQRDDGLIIGDEFIYNGSEEIPAKFQDVVERRYNRYAGTWATPPGHVLAGTVVTTFGAKQYLNTSEVDNPYKDYVTTIVLEQGDTLRGRSIGGRIFVNFSERASYGLGVVRQLIPPGSVGWPNGYPVETSAQREWDYSWTRTTLSSSGAQQTQTITVTLPNGTTQEIRTQVDTNLAMVRSHQFFGLEGHPRMEMDTRGILWLQSTPEPDPNGVVVRATAMNAFAEMPEADVTAQHDVTVSAQSMTANAFMPKVAEDETGDVEIVALPMLASATFTNYGKTVYAQPMTATAELVENFNMVHTSGEQVKLTIHNYDVEIYLKEDG